MSKRKDPLPTRPITLDMVKCAHGVSYKHPCPACAEVWRQDRIRAVRAQAEKLGFALVPMQEAARDG